MAYDITPERINRWKSWLEKNPIDHAYDEEAELLDGDVPMAQLDSRQCYRLLKRAEKLVRWVTSQRDFHILLESICLKTGAFFMPKTCYGVKLSRLPTG